MVASSQAKTSQADAGQVKGGQAKSWQTKFGSRRVRHDPPTLTEALVAAQGLTDTRDHQVEIAAELMGVSLDEARAELKKLRPERTAVTIVAQARDKGTRAVVVERKVSRRQVGRLPG